MEMYCLMQSSAATQELRRAPSGTSSGGFSPALLEEESPFLTPLTVPQRADPLLSAGCLTGMLLSVSSDHLIFVACFPWALG